jgi:hypothetical protein
MELTIDNDQLQTVTENFTKDATRFNFINVKRLIIRQTIAYPDSFYDYLNEMMILIRFVYNLLTNLQYISLHKREKKKKHAHAKRRKVKRIITPLNHLLINTLKKRRKK